MKRFGKKFKRRLRKKKSTAKNLITFGVIAPIGLATGARVTEELGGSASGIGKVSAVAPTVGTIGGVALIGKAFSIFDPFKKKKHKRF